MLRKYLTCTAMSLFLAWHTLAMIVAPAPDSDLSNAFRAALQPYLTLFRLDSKWDFFAPNVGEGSRLRYTVEAGDGRRLAFIPAGNLSWLHPDFFWVRAWYYAVMDDPERYAASLVARLCKEHASLTPSAITLMELQEEKFTRDDFLAGKSRTDPEFFTTITIKRLKCQP